MGSSFGNSLSAKNRGKAAYNKPLSPNPNPPKAGSLGTGVCPSKQTKVKIQNLSKDISIVKLKISIPAKFITKRTDIALNLKAIEITP